MTAVCDQESKTIKTALQIIEMSAGTVSTSNLINIMKLDGSDVRTLRRGLRRHAERGHIHPIGRFSDGSMYWCWWDTDETDAEKTIRAAALASKEIIHARLGKVVNINTVIDAVRSELDATRNEPKIGIADFLKSAPHGVKSCTE